MGYVTIAASSCHQRYNQHATFQLIKTTSPHHQQLVARNNLNDIVMNTSYSLLTTDLLTERLDQTMQQIPHDWYQTQHSKRELQLKRRRFSPATVPQPTAGYPVASRYNATTDYPVAISSHQQLI
ncbi:phytoene synthase 2, chloroplastic-like [Dorcoceras hygrometricum]|uniref:Phytoene synthase 2, chloroplastic-like n=1 Tax=Dorcoceras hygrometricum TaxID=472368 RepID=A0A2Z7B190_9LAMI|nr:phytoene synthase 2, chloroplastic-like [Dorcoceras hygrometricum]